MSAFLGAQEALQKGLGLADKFGRASWAACMRLFADAFIDFVFVLFLV